MSTRKTGRGAMKRCLMSRVAIVVLATVSASCLGHEAAAQEITWINPAGGSWHDAANWDPQNVPNTDGEIAVIPDDGSAYTITLGTNTSLAEIDFFNPLSTLSLSDHNLHFYQPDGFTNYGTVLVDLGVSSVSGKVANMAGASWDLLDDTSLTLNAIVFENHGTIRLNPLLGPAGTSIAVYSSAQITGSGELLMQTDGVGSTASIWTYYSTLTHGSDHTIRGGGNLRAQLNNYGTVNADRPGDPLFMYEGNRNNYGLLAATAGGQLVIGSGTTSQYEEGQIFADDAEVLVNSSATINGGSFNTANGGYIVVDGEATTLTDVTQLGEMRISGQTQVQCQGTITNDGDIYVNHALDDDPSRLRFYGGNATLAGNGTIHLQTLNDRDDAYLSTYYTTVTHEAGHTIEGGGTVYAALINAGTLRADRPGDPLYLASGGKTNHGVIEATGGGEIILQDGAITQSASGLIRTDDGKVTLEAAARISGGHLESDNGGFFETTVTGPRLDGVTSAAELRLSGPARLEVMTSLVNDGDIHINHALDGDDTRLQVSGSPVLVDGSGTIHMQTAGDPNDAQITDYYSGITQGENHTIRGGGTIQATFTNQGLVSADRPGDPLRLTSHTKTNHGLVQAIGGGELAVSAVTITQGETGALLADGGVVALGSAANIQGGQLASSGGGLVECRSEATLQSVRSDAHLAVLEGCRLDLSVACENNGTIIVNPTGHEANTYVRAVNGNLVLSGTGEIVLCAGDDLYDAAFTDYYTTVRHMEGHTVRGTGRITGTFENHGRILADQPHRLLELTGGHVPNHGLVAAQDSAIVRFVYMSQNYASQTLLRGRWHAHEASSLYLMGADLHKLDAEVLLDGPGSMVYRDDGVSDALLHLAQVDSLGHFWIENERDFLTEGALHNEGRVTVGAACSLVVNGPYTQAGTNPAGHNYDGSGWTEVNGVLWPLAAAPLAIEGGTLLGNGTVAASVHSGGRIDPGSSVGRLTIDGLYTQTSAGVLYCELGGRNQGEYDHLQVNGPAELAGTLWIRVLDGFTPVAGDTFQVLSCESLTGAFEVQFGSPGIGLQYEIQYHDTYVTVVFYEDVSAAPDPEHDPQFDPGDDVSAIPAQLALQARPVSGGADLWMALPAPAAVDLSIYDMGGRRLATLASGDQPAGLHPFRWDGRDEQGQPLASGVYFARARVHELGGERLDAHARVLIVR